MSDEREHLQKCWKRFVHAVRQLQSGDEAVVDRYRAYIAGLHGDACAARAAESVLACAVHRVWRPTLTRRQAESVNLGTMDSTLNPEQ